jgi:hypothetical protein
MKDSHNFHFKYGRVFIVVVLFIIESYSCKSTKEYLLAQIIAETAKAHVSNVNGF